MRPIYHKNDNAKMVYLHLGLFGYWILNKIRHQLKTKKNKPRLERDFTNIKYSKTVKTSIVDDQENTIFITKCSEPNLKLKEIHQALKYKSRPVRIKKFVVPKPEHIKHKVTQIRYFAG